MDRLFYLGSEEMGRTSRERRGLKSNLAQGQKIGNCKLRGEWAELCFMARAAGMGLCVCKPYGDSAQYDVGIEEDGRMLRVQIKSTTYARDGAFTCNVVGRGRKGYAAGVVDFFAIYLVPLNVWYILPFEALAGTVSLQFAPGREGNKYRAYLEAWHLLRGARLAE
jgi:hypothetical protein